MSIFNIEPRRRVKRSKFHMNHEVKTTARFGEITPIMCQEVLPGDTWKLQTEQFIRFAPTLAPVMHRVNSFLHYYFVPNRLLMRDNWEDFISPTGLPDEERPELPYLIFDGIPAGSPEGTSTAYDVLIYAVVKSRLLDHYGFQFAGDWVDSDDGSSPRYNACCYDGRLKVPLLPICAYWLIMQDYYLDENQYDIRRIKKELLEICKIGECKVSDFINKTNTDIDWSLFESDFNGSHPATAVGFVLMMLELCQRAWEKDYFTSALPSTQRGADVTLGGVQQLDNAFVSVDGAKVKSQRVTFPESGEYSPSPAGTPLTLGTAKNAAAANIAGSTFDGDISHSVSNSPATIEGEIDDDTKFQVTTAEGTVPTINPVTINELRRAIKLQEFLEKSMRGGYRLIEQIFSHFGVISSNKLLDRAQYIGGNINPVTISEVTGTATTDLSHLGEYSGHMQSFGGSRTIKFRSEEHGWLFCFLSVIPRTNYCQGIPRMFQRHDLYDFAWPEFAHLGEQEVWMNELYNGSAGDLDPHETFGYQSRYAEYKYIPSQISGDFKGNLSYWTMARQFSSKPTLSPAFLSVSPTDDTNTDIFTIQDDSDYLYCQFYHKVLAKRCLPKFGVPML